MVSEEKEEREKKTASCPIVKKKKSKTKKKKSQNLPDDTHFIWPVERSKCWISSLFGHRKQTNSFHYGVDMAAFKGTPVKAAQNGIITEARLSRGYGNTILINHDKKYKTRYAHLDKILVTVGQKVNQGDLIGKVGATGNVRASNGGDPSHLHFEIYSFGTRVNPLNLLKK